MADNRPIGIFDSGLGGLTVAKEIMRVLPGEDIVYFGDTGRVPYGSRSKETIRKYALEDENFLLKQNVKMIVAACGTVSSVASDIGANLCVPYFEVVSPAVRAAVASTTNKKIGVIGTNATINSGEHKRQILELLPDAQVFVEGCPLFVPLVEEGWFDANDNIVKETVERYLKSIKSAGVDTIILGCTHYPILSEAIRLFMGDGVTLINAGISTAGEISEYIENNGMANENKNTGKRDFYVSDKPDSFRAVASILLGKEINLDNLQQVEINSL